MGSVKLKGPLKLDQNTIYISPQVDTQILTDVTQHVGFYTYLQHLTS